MRGDFSQGEVPERLLALIEAVRSKDYFECLGVARDASTSEIREAYRARVLELDAFRPYSLMSSELAESIADAAEVLEDALDVLSDPDRRLEYRRAL